MINFIEFSPNLSSVMNNEVQALFKSIDTDNNGYISISEMKTFTNRMKWKNYF